MLSTISKSERYVFYALIFLFVLLHSHFMTAPPNGYHQWRESDTSAIILNYYQEDANFFHQRCNQRGDGSGITGGEFPTYSYVSAMFYYLFGAHHVIPRIITMIGAIIALFYFFRTVRLLSDEHKALYSTLALAFSPLFLFYSFKIMPDIWMLMFMLISVCLFVKYVKSGAASNLILSSIALFFSATIKPLGLCLFLPYLVYLLNNSENKKSAIFIFSGYSIFTFAAVAGWYLYGVYLNTVHHTEAFHTGQLILKSHEYLMQSQFYKKLFLQWPFELWFGWAMLPIFVYGIIKIRKESQRSFVFIWIAACYIVFAIVAAHAGSHDYYTLVILPPIAAISGWGLSELAKKENIKKWLLIYLAVVIPIVSFMRIAVRFSEVEEFDTMRAAAENHIPRESLVIVDETTSAIRLYQLNRHGWAFRDTLTYDKIQPLVKRGGEFLLLRKPLDSVETRIKTLVNDSLIQFGPLFGYKTVKPD